MKKAADKQEKIGFASRKTSSDLEDVFLDCLSEVKKDVLRRRKEQLGGVTFSRGASANVSKSNSLAGGSFSSLPVAGRHNNYVSNEDVKELHASDKKRVIERLLGNESVLMFIYENMFPAQQQNLQFIASQLKTGAGKGSVEMPRLDQSIGTSQTLKRVGSHFGVASCSSPQFFGGSKPYMASRLKALPVDDYYERSKHIKLI